MVNFNKIYPSIQQPMKKNRNGFFTVVFSENTIRQSIIHILNTRLGERVHLPEFGSRIHELVFEQMDDEFRVLAEEYVFEAIRKWEPRVDVLSAIVTFSRRNDNTANLYVQYRIRRPVPSEETLLLQINRDSGLITG